jgi:hypothetical protein
VELWQSDFFCSNHASVKDVGFSKKLQNVQLPPTPKGWYDLVRLKWNFANHYHNGMYCSNSPRQIFIILQQIPPSARSRKP